MTYAPCVTITTTTTSPPQQHLLSSLMGPHPPVLNPNNGCNKKGKGKGKGKGKSKGDNGSNSSNSSGGSSSSAWPSFYNPWIGTITMWLGMHPPLQSVHSLAQQHAMLVGPGYYGALAELCSCPCQHPKCTSSRVRPLLHHPRCVPGINSHWSTPSAPSP
jgi:hypothetical protein